MGVGGCCRGGSEKGWRGGVDADGCFYEHFWLAALKRGAWEGGCERRGCDRGRLMLKRKERSV